MGRGREEGRGEWEGERRRGKRKKELKHASAQCDRCLPVRVS